MAYDFLNSVDSSRRAFLRGAARSLLGVGTLPLLADQAFGRPDAADDTSLTDKAQKPTPNPRNPKPCKSVIYVYLSGGMSHLDSFDTKPGASTQGPVQSIKTSADGVLVSEYFPKMAKQMHHVAVLNSMNSNQGAHEQGRYLMHTGYMKRGTVQHPDMGAWSAYFLKRVNPMLPANVKVGGASNGLGAGFLESRYAALPIGNPTSGLQHIEVPASVDPDQFTRRLDRLNKMNQQFLDKVDTKPSRAYAGMYDEAVKLMNCEDVVAFDINVEDDATRQRYGDNALGQGCLLARRLVEHGVRFIEVNDGGWDTHSDNFTRVAEKGAVLDQALASLIGDLNDRGLLDDTLIVLATEFGRTPTIVNNNAGRNHYPKAFTCLLAGGGIVGGQKYGKTDAEGRQVVENRVSVPDFNATIGYALDLPLDKEVYSPSRRPFTVGDKGRPVIRLFG